MSDTRKPPLTSKEEVLNALADAISIPPETEKKASDRYNSIGNWLNRDNSTIKEFGPALSPQGSFMQGTAIQPVSENDAYDVDVVCEFQSLNKNRWSQAQLKTALGVEINSYVVTHNMKNAAENNRRCWTLEYADEANFHMDILPCVPNAADYRLAMSLAQALGSNLNDGNAETAVGITDKKHPNYNSVGGEWLISNPKGYARWFRSRQKVVLEKRRQEMMKEGRVVASVEQVPNHEFRTPLQESIKLLKRHRDVMFDGHEDKPISIIISTLAAKAYSGQGTILETLKAILPVMHEFIELREGKRWVANPSYILENFADKWAEKPSKKRAFENWLLQANRDFGEYIRGSRFDVIPAGMKERMTDRTIAKVTSSLQLAAPALILSSLDVASAEAEKVIADKTDTKPWLLK